MTFEEILDQALDMLRHRGRVTYGALKRQFNLDDAYLEDLKNEIVEGQQQAVDEGGKVLVWTGRPAAAAREPTSEATPSASRPTASLTARPDRRDIRAWPDRTATHWTRDVRRRTAPAHRVVL